MYNSKSPDPANEWDKYCKEQEKAIERYREENTAKQDCDLEDWLDTFIKNWNPFHILNNPKMIWNEKILLGIYICDYYQRESNKYLIKGQRGDVIFNILENFPLIDAIDDDDFIATLESNVNVLSKYLEDHNE
jgi:hypothetical protein